MFYFMRMVYSYNNETGILGVIETFFTAQSWWENVREFLENSFSEFYTFVIVSLTFLQKR